MKLDPKSRAITSFFMVIAVIVMLALAWSVSQDNNTANYDEASQTVEQSQQ
jgi:hypothetical protein